MMKRLILITLVVLTNSCGQPKNQQKSYDGGVLPLMQRVEAPYTTLDITNAVEIDYDSLIEDVQYVQLGKEKGLIAVVRQILYHNEKYYIFDSQQEAVFIFDETGACIKKIDAIGRGPKEYLGIANIDIDTENNELLIGDRLSNNILFFDLDGNFKYRRNFRVQRAYILHLKDSTLVSLVDPFQNRGNPELGLYGLVALSADSVTHKAFKYLPVQDGYCGEENLRRGYKCIYYKPLYSDSVYRINPDMTYSLAYHAKIENSAWEKNKDSEKFMNLLTEDNKLFSWLFETKDFFIGYTYYNSPNNKFVWVIYDKIKEITYRSYMKEYSKIDQLNRLWGYNVWGTKDDSFTTYVTASDLENAKIKERYKNGSLKITDPKLEQIVKNIGDNDNPMLVLLKFKSR